MQALRTPRLVIAGPASGTGKTTVAMGLMAALRAAGLAVSCHKVGPDYIDPGYHALAAGRPGRNLDAFLCGEELIGPLFAHGAAGADIAIIEGAMGLFDGVADAATSAGDADYASTAHIARLLRAPVILVVDAAAVGRSVAALVAGFAGFDPRVRIAGVIFNRVGSARHERLLTDAVRALGIGVFGAIRRTDAIVTPARHLGLIPAAERRTAAERTISQLAGLIAASCDLGGLRATAATAPPLTARAWDPVEVLATGRGSRECFLSSRAFDTDFADESRARIKKYSSVTSSAAPSNGAAGGVRPARGSRPVVAVAQGPAFTFGYTEHAELLRAAGADLAPFDPLADEALPDGTAGLCLGGGFPEMYAAELSANAQLRRQVSALAARGAPIVAECAGLLYLARSLDAAPMCGVLPADAHMAASLTLGYRAGVATADSVLARAGAPVCGHEFHRTVAEPACGDTPAWQLSSGRGAGGARSEGHVLGNVLATYLHLHWARTPSFASRLVSACAAAEAAP